ncbi:uncharacterized protein [Clytia hemisphaerica]|uniref:ZP domain-containing protein n=1 Tax=Clytia hemisphaerica TaxID=252671 RepID=A0A7M6DK95_9CNID
MFGWLLVIIFFLSTAHAEDLVCQYKPGNGIGKREYRVGKIHSPLECSTRCIEMKKRRSDINGVIHSARYRVCYCIGTMQGRRRNPTWKSCFLVNKNSQTTQTSPGTEMFRNYQCNYEAGFGYGGSQYYIGQKQSQAHCADNCHQMSIATNPNVNGASYEERTRRCICKSQMRGRERSLTWKSCLFEAAAPTTSAVTAYKPISKVSGSKEKKKKKKDRKKKNRKNKGGKRKNKKRKNKNKKNKKKKKKTTTSTPFKTLVKSTITSPKTTTTTTSTSTSTNPTTTSTATTTTTTTTLTKTTPLLTTSTRPTTTSRTPTMALPSPSTTLIEKTRALINTMAPEVTTSSKASTTVTIATTKTTMPSNIISTLKPVFTTSALTSTTSKSTKETLAATTTTASQSATTSPSPSTSTTVTTPSPVVVKITSREAGNTLTTETTPTPATVQKTKATIVTMTTNLPAILKRETTQDAKFPTAMVSVETSTDLYRSIMTSRSPSQSTKPSTKQGRTTRKTSAEIPRQTSTEGSPETTPNTNKVTTKPLVTKLLVKNKSPSKSVRKTTMENSSQALVASSTISPKTDNTTPTLRVKDATSAKSSLNLPTISTVDLLSNVLTKEDYTTSSKTGNNVFSVQSTTTPVDEKTEALVETTTFIPTELPTDTISSTSKKDESTTQKSTTITSTKTTAIEVESNGDSALTTRTAMVTESPNTTSPKGVVDTTISSITEEESPTPITDPTTTTDIAKSALSSTTESTTVLPTKPSEIISPEDKSTATLSSTTELPIVGGNSILSTSIEDSTTTTTILATSSTSTKSTITREITPPATSTKDTTSTASNLDDCTTHDTETEPSPPPQYSTTEDNEGVPTEEADKATELPTNKRNESTSTSEPLSTSNTRNNPTQILITSDEVSTTTQSQDIDTKNSTLVTLNTSTKPTNIVTTPSDEFEQKDTEKPTTSTLEPATFETKRQEESTTKRPTSTPSVGLSNETDLLNNATLESPDPITTTSKPSSKSFYITEPEYETTETRPATETTSSQKVSATQEPLSERTTSPLSSPVVNVENTSLPASTSDTSVGLRTTETLSTSKYAGNFTSSMNKMQNDTFKPTSEARNNFNIILKNNDSESSNAARDTKGPITPRPTVIINVNKTSSDNDIHPNDKINSTVSVTPVQSIYSPTNHSLVFDNKTITLNPNTTVATKTQKSSTKVFLNVTKATTEGNVLTIFNLATTGGPKSERPETPLFKNITRGEKEEKYFTPPNLPTIQPKSENFTKAQNTVSSTEETAIKNERLELKTLSCDNGMMRIILRTQNDENSLRQHTKNITLSDTSCQFSVLNQQEMILETEYGRCGAIVHQTGKHIIYKNQIFHWDDMEIVDNVIRSNGDGEPSQEIFVKCKVERQYQSSLDGKFKPKHSSVVQITKTEYGKMELSMSLFKTSLFNNKYITREFPIVVNMQDLLYVELSMNTTSKELALSPQQCYATITEDPEDDFRYSIFKDRCPTDDTFNVVRKTSHTMQFQTKVFDFLKKNKGIYMHCTSTICKADSKHPVCEFGCEPAQTDRKNRRRLDHKEKAPNEIYTVTSGFIEFNHGDDNFLNSVELAAVLIAVTLIAVVSIIAAVYFYRQRRQNINNTSSSDLVTYL